jgi:AbrB family looped-hinge helix DNA binding protein
MSRVTSKGQVTIPKEIRERLGIQPGDEIEFEETDEGYVIRKDIEENRFEKWRGVVDTDQTVKERMADLRGTGE